MKTRKNGVRNEYEVKGDVAYLYITNKNHENYEVLFDAKYLEKVKQIKWTVNEKGYCVSSKVIEGKYILLHRLIMDCPEGMVVDHRNHNVWDNREENLRVCTQRENLYNVKLRKDNRAGLRGIGWSKKYKKYQCRININGVRKHIGYFNTAEEAYQARLDAEEKYYGEFQYVEEKVDEKSTAFLFA